MNFIFEQLEIIIPYNLLLVIIIEETDNLFVVDDCWVEELRFWKPFNKAKKCSRIMSQVHS